VTPVTRIALLLAMLGSVAVALAAPATATAGGVSAVTRSVAVPTGKVQEVRTAVPFDLAGLRWRGPGRIELRTRRVGGVWSSWRDAAPEREDRPDPRSREGRGDAGWTLGNPWWVGPSDRLQLRALGRVTDVRATLVRSPEVRVPLRALTTTEPAIVPRSEWGADESLRKDDPVYAPALRFAIVHHTAGTNAYTRSEAAAIVRGIQLFHVRSNGWNDIGYNFLVDRFGIVYEGRYGGIDRNVVGAHALGFNTGSVGVALLGTYTTTKPSAAAEKSLAALLAWRLDLAHVDPQSTLTVLSGGSERFPVGVPVLLRAVAGHRDTGLTVCPGNALYARLGELARRAASTGGPKIYAPAAVGTDAGSVRFEARLSRSLRWSVAVVDATGREVARGTGAGTTVDWTWEAATATRGRYRWTISAGTGSAVARPATGTIGVAGQLPDLGLGAAAEPTTISPNGDGQADTTTITFSLTVDATVEATVLDEAGLEVLALTPARWRRAGEHAFTFDGGELPDGRYTVRLVARTTDGDEAEKRVPVSVTRTLGPVSITPAVFSPNGDGVADRLTVRFVLTRPADVVLRVVRDGKWVATPFSGAKLAGTRVVRWDGSKRIGRLLDGSYTALLEVTDAVGTTRVTFPFSSDTSPPRPRLVSRTPPQLEVDEASSLRIVVNGAVRRIRTTGPATVRIPGVRTVRTLRVIARDRVGNLSRPLSIHGGPKPAE
jgi:N-acetylmuramoyl-L-alanine amidase